MKFYSPDSLADLRQITPFAYLLETIQKRFGPKKVHQTKYFAYLDLCHIEIIKCVYICLLRCVHIILCTGVLLHKISVLQSYFINIRRLVK
jgi:hypothetical protein